TVCATHRRTPSVARGTWCCARGPRRDPRLRPDVLKVIEEFGRLGRVPSSSLPRHPPRLDDVHYPYFTRAAAAVGLHAPVLLRERVDVVRCPVLRNLDDPTPDRQVTVRVVGVEDRQGDPGIAPHVLVLDPSARRI